MLLKDHNGGGCLIRASGAFACLCFSLPLSIPFLHPPPPHTHSVGHAHVWRDDRQSMSDECAVRESSALRGRRCPTSPCSIYMLTVWRRNPLSPWWKNDEEFGGYLTVIVQCASLVITVLSFLHHRRRARLPGSAEPLPLQAKTHDGGRPPSVQITLKWIRLDSLCCFFRPIVSESIGGGGGGEGWGGGRAPSLMKNSALKFQACVRLALVNVLVLLLGALTVSSNCNRLGNYKVAWRLLLPLGLGGSKNSSFSRIKQDFVCAVTLLHLIII